MFPEIMKYAEKAYKTVGDKSALWSLNDEKKKFLLIHVVMKL